MTVPINSLATKTEYFQRAELASILRQCTEKQQAFFNRVFPDGVPNNKLSGAYDLCKRTVDKNRKE